MPNVIKLCVGINEHCFLYDIMPFAVTPSLEHIVCSYVTSVLRTSSISPNPSVENKIPQNVEDELQNDAQKITTHIGTYICIYKWNVCYIS
mgnify:CR=1 FL=1